MFAFVYIHDCRMLVLARICSSHCMSLELIYAAREALQTSRSTGRIEARERNDSLVLEIAYQQGVSWEVSVLSQEVCC